MARIIIFPNDRKEKREDPDYTMWLVPKDDTRNGQGKNGHGKNGQDKNGKGKHGPGINEKSPDNQELPEDVPF